METWTQPMEMFYLTISFDILLCFLFRCQPTKQCYRSGWFSKVLCDKFSCKSSPNIWQRFGLFWIILLSENVFDYLSGIFLEKIEILFPTSDHAATLDLIKLHHLPHWQYPTRFMPNLKSHLFKRWQKKYSNKIVTTTADGI